MAGTYHTTNGPFIRSNGFYVGLHYNASFITVAVTGRTLDAGYIWDDGTLLNGNLLNLTNLEPVRDDTTNVFNMNEQIINNVPAGWQCPCMCQSFCWVLLTLFSLPSRRLRSELFENSPMMYEHSTYLLLALETHQTIFVNSRYQAFLSFN